MAIIFVCQFKRDLACSEKIFSAKFIALTKFLKFNFVRIDHQLVEIGFLIEQVMWPNFGD
jgi:hypothetical protein